MNHSKKPHSILFAVLAIVGFSFGGCRKEPAPSTSRPVERSPDTLVARSGLDRPTPPKPVDEMSRAERIAFVKVLTDSGVYRCCIKPGCTTCLYETDENCRCADLVRAKDPVCGECYRGWKRGKGSVSGVEAAEVRRQ